MKIENCAATVYEGVILEPDYRSSLENQPLSQVRSVEQPSEIISGRVSTSIGIFFALPNAPQEKLTALRSFFMTAERISAKIPEITYIEGTRIGGQKDRRQNQPAAAWVEPQVNKMIEMKNLEESKEKEEEPQIFDIYNVWLEFKEKVKQVGKERALLELAPLLRKQFRAVILEMVGLPNTDELLYALRQDERGLESAYDDQYLSETNIVKLSTEGWIYALGHRTRSERRLDAPILEFFFQLHREEVIDPVQVPNIERRLIAWLGDDLLLNDHARAPKKWRHRFLREAWQIFQLVYIELPKYPQFSHWIITGLTKTYVHRGGKAFMLAYKKDGHLLKKIGYYANISDKKMAHIYEKLGKPGVEVDEVSLLNTFVHLPDSESLEAMDVLMMLAELNGDKKIKKKIENAKKRYEKQLPEIAKAEQVAQEIFGLESERFDSGQKERLEAALRDVVLHQLILGEELAPKEMIEKFHSVLLAGKGSQEYLNSLVGVMPGLAISIGGWVAWLFYGLPGAGICGSMSAAAASLNVFGKPTMGSVDGLSINNLLSNDYCPPRECLGCGNKNIGSKAVECFRCLWKKGMPKGYQPIKHLATIAKNNMRSGSSDAANRSHKPERTTNFIDTVLSPKRSVSGEKILQFGPKNSVGLQALFAPN